MTAQAMDSLTFEGRHYQLACEPLADWLYRRKNRKLRFRSRTTACWRGYDASWEVARGRLYLTSFSATQMDGTPATIDSLFANYSRQYLDSVKADDPDNAGPGRFAFWCTDTLICPFGARIKYKHAGYLSRYEKELWLTFKDGFLIGQQIVSNEPPPRADCGPAASALYEVLTPTEVDSELMHLRDREWRASRSSK
jgi:hypothetical protein